MKKSEKMITSTALLACPLCGCADLMAEHYGIECRSCGLWLGDGTRMRDRFGSLERAWNSRHANAQISGGTPSAESVR